MEKVERIRKALTDNRIYAEVEKVKDGVVKVTIEEGDWKQAHRYADYLIEEMFPDCTITQRVTESDGSDCYSAEHYVFI